MLYAVNFVHGRNAALKVNFLVGRLLGTCGGVCSEKAMAPHSSTLAWKIPWRVERTVHGVTKNKTGASEHAHKHVVLATNILKLRFHSTFLQTYVGLTARF